MKTYQDRAVKLFKEGYNCAQSVLCTYCDDLGIDCETALKMSSSFGGGMGRLREVCGAVSMMFLIAGFKHGYIESNNDEAKAKHYALIQKLAEEFKQKHGTIICRELLGINDNSPVPSKRTEQYYASRPCEEFIKTAVEIINKNL